MLMTSDYAQKMIKKLEEEKSQLCDNILKYSTFIVSTSEGDPEELRPEFDLVEIVKQIKYIDAKILKIRHARNVFNATTIVDGTDMTVDMVLIQMPILNKESRTYLSMGNAQQKERRSTYGDSVEYKYTNYDIAWAKELGNAKQDKLLELQEKLNLLNSTVTFEVDI